MATPLQIYLAAVYTNQYLPGGNRYPQLTDYEKGLMEDVKKHNILESWHYVGKQSYVNNMRENGAKIFLDSGAFSAWTLGVELKVEDYVNYIKRNQDIIRVEDGDLMASVLDGIGDPQKTFENQMAMEAMGVRPLPCFHANEDERYLEWYVKNYSYITLGGMVGANTQQLINWLDRIWDRYLMDPSGNAKIKVHGFGITAVPIMERYPWYSCDSSSWIQSTAFGVVVTPKHGPLSVSEKSPSRHDAGQHLWNMSPPERAYLEQMLRNEGFDPDRLATVYESRAAYNLIAYMEIEKIINAAKACQKVNITRELF